MLYYCIGIARCGKSTYCNNWVQEKPGRVIVCADDIRLALHGKRFESKAEPMVDAIKTTMIRAHLLRGVDVIVDGTHTTESSIRKMLELYYNAQYVLFNTSKEVCLERAKLTNQIDLYPVIDRMNKQLTALKEQGIDNIVAKIRANLVPDRTA